MTRIGSTARQITAVGFALLLVTSTFAFVSVVSADLGDLSNDGALIEGAEDGQILDTFESAGGVSVTEGASIFGTYGVAIGGAGTGEMQTINSIEDSYSVYYRADSTAYVIPLNVQQGVDNAAPNIGRFDTFGGDIRISTQDSGPTATGVSVSAGTTYKLTVYPDFANDSTRFVVRDIDSGTQLVDQSLSYVETNNVFDTTITYNTQDATSGALDNWEVNGGPPPKYTVSGTVTATGGSALEGVTVSSGTGVSAVTDATGAYSMELEDGSYTLTASKSGFADGTASVTVSGSAVMQDFTLSPENSTINGSVEDQEGEPLTDSTIKLEDGSGNVVDTTQSDALGDWSFPVGPGDYTVKAQKTYYADASKAVTYDGTNVSSGHVLIQGRLGRWDSGLYTEMKDNYDGNLTGEIGYLCEFDPESTYSRTFEAFWNWTGSDRDRYDIAGCEPDMSSSTQLDMFHAAASLNQSEQEMFVVMSNRLVDTRGVAYTEAKIAAVNAMNNGANESEAQDAARAAVGGYYSTIQNNVLTRWEAGTAQADYIDDARVDAGGSGWQYVQASNGAHGDGGNSMDGKATATVTLVDGSERTLTTYRTGTSVVSPLPSKTNSSDGAVVEAYKIRVYSDSDRNASTVIVPTEQYKGILHEIEAQDDAVKANVGTLVSDVYSRYQAGEIDSSDLISPVELASRASTNYDSTGYYSFAAAELSALGYGGDVNMSHVITIETVNETSGAYENVTVEGTLFYTADDISNLTTGQRYEPAGYNGTFLMATADGVFEVNDPFTIESTIDVTDGTELSTTSLETYDYATTDASTLLLMLEELKELRTSIENSETESNTGGGWNFGFDLSGFSIAGIPGAVVVGLIIIGTVFLLGKTNGSGPRY